MDREESYVISRTGVPSSGSAVRVTGRVTPGATVLGKALGVAINKEPPRQITTAAPAERRAASAGRRRPMPV